MYYLQSRYYDPEIGRFINADAFASTGQGILGSNMFAYCGNKPVVGYDPSGESNEAVPLGGNTYYVPPVPPRTIDELLSDFLISIGLISTVSVEISNPLIDIIVSSTVKEETKEISKPVTLYFGVKLENGQFIPKSGPMVFLDAFLWALLRRTDPSFGKGSSWGLYTASAHDAFLMASALGCQAQPILHPAHQNGYLEHYHVAGFTFLQYYKHFHVWYG